MSFRFFQPREETLMAEPFPHMDWSHAVEPGFYAELSATFPLDQFGSALDGDNRVHRLGSKQLLQNAATRDCWRDLMTYLTSQAFWHELVTMLGSEFRSRHGYLEQRLGKPLEAWQVSRRWEAPGDIVLEALAVINTPVRTKPTHVKGTHIDRAGKLWTGLLYMRDDDDDTPGGDLHLHRPRGDLVFDKHQIPRAMTEVVKTVPYEANHFVGFVNGPEAIHSVGSRPITAHVRRYFDLVVELPRGNAFTVPQMRPLQRMAYRLSGQREPSR